MFRICRDEFQVYSHLRFFGTFETSVTLPLQKFDHIDISESHPCLYTNISTLEEMVHLVTTRALMGLELLVNTRIFEYPQIYRPLA